MYSKRELFLFCLLGLFVIGMKYSSEPETWNASTPVYEVLNAFGEKLPAHAVTHRDETQIQRGKELVHQGRTIGPDGKKSKYISKFYLCINCHSTVQEDPDLREFNPETRLSYVAEKGLKFLQGSPFFGIANRESWYNDDYILKYGDLVIPASKSLAESTQLCAKVCSSGRYLEDWELNAILAYYWDIQFKLGDLALSEKELNQINQAKKGDNPEMIALIKSKYALKSPATFGEVPENPAKGYGLKGDPNRGKLIFELSCMTCHSEEGVSGMSLSPSKLTFKKFENNLDKNTDYNLYHISRHGTYADKGKPRYMPLYTEERLSNQQVEDLRAYIVQEAN